MGSLGAPGGVIAIAPGGELGGASRGGVIEAKTGPDHIVVWAPPTTVLLYPGHNHPVGEWHVTVHRDLMVHARSSDRRTTIPLLNAAEVRHSARLLLTVTTAPGQYRKSTRPQQTS